MFERNSDSKSGLEKAINDILKEMSDASPDSEEYAKMADQLEKLYKLKEVDSKRAISYDTLFTVAVNFLGIVWITRYERDSVVTTKALSFIRTLRP